MRFKQRFMKYTVISFFLLLANDFLNFLVGAEINYAWDMVYLLPVLSLFGGICSTSFFSLFEKDII